MTAIDVFYEERDGVLVATLRGEIDMSNDDSLRIDLERRLDNEDFGAVLDLAGVDYIDSTGIQLLYQLARRLETRGQRLRIVVPQGSVVADTLRYANALDLLGGASSVPEAMAEIRA